MTEPRSPSASDDAYLWDGSGHDPFVADLERALSPLRSSSTTPPPLPKRRPPAGALPLVCSLALVAVFVVVGGAPRLTVLSAGSSSRLAVGGVLQTNDDVAAVDLGAHGVLTLQPHSRLRLVANSRQSQEVFLERGSVSAIVDAPPRFFSVATPAVRAVDLGCAYDVTVDEDGASLVRVTSGLVALEGPDHELTLVPAGASARTNGGNGARALPFANDASAALREAALAINDDGAVERVLALAGAGDGISVWHLVVWAKTPPEKARRAERLATISPPPAGITLDNLDTAALFRWRDLIDAELLLRTAADPR